MKPTYRFYLLRSPCFTYLLHLAMPTLDQLPFLKSLCWQGQTASIAHLAEDEILQLYERGWRYRGVMADLSDVEKTLLQQLASKYHSWLINEL